MSLRPSPEALLYCRHRVAAGALLNSVQGAELLAEIDVLLGERDEARETATQLLSALQKSRRKVDDLLDEREELEE